MSAFNLAISTDGAAFDDDNGGALPEVARLLRAIADRMDGGEWAGTVVDVNGNSCGAFLHHETEVNQ